jgi:uncharacterized membrane protein
MKIYFLPKTKLGKCSVLLILLMPLLFKTGFLAAKNYYSFLPAGKTIIEDIASRPMVALPMLTGFFSGIAAFIIGVNSIVKKSEKSLLTYISTTVGLLVILFLLGEILFPH